MSEDRDKFKPVLVSVLSSLGYLVGDLLSYPLDTVITHLRLQQSPHSIYHTTQHIFNTHGINTLFRGASLATFTTFVPCVIYFYTYQQLMYKLHTAAQRYKTGILASMKTFLPMGVACVAEGLSLIVKVPFDVVRTRLQSGLTEYRHVGVFESISDMLRNEGIIRPYKTAHIYMVLAISFTCLQFQFMESLRTYFKTDHVGIILISTLFATVLTNPIDYLMTRHCILQSDTQCLKVQGLLQQIQREHGWQVFMRGTLGKLMLNTWSSMAWYSMYSQLKDYSWRQGE